MVIQYENTFEEFSEASLALASTKKRKSPGKRIAALVVTALFFYTATHFWISYGEMDITVVFVHLVAPVVITFVIAAVVGLFNAVVSRKSPKATLGSMISVGVIAIIAMEFSAMLALRRITRAPAAALDWKILMPHTGWAFFLTWIMVVALYNRRKNLRVMWDTQPSLHRLKTVDISAEGVEISDDKTRLQYSWSAFIGWQETKTLFMLKLSPKVVHFLPKRAFAGDEELSAMRALCELIPKSTDAAFPVITNAESFAIR